MLQQIVSDTFFRRREENDIHSHEKSENNRKSDEARRIPILVAGFVQAQQVRARAQASRRYLDAHALLRIAVLTCLEHDDRTV